MIVVGYNNSRGAYLLQNSWGEKWAESGRGWMSYTSFRDMVREAYVANDLPVTTPTGQAMQFSVKILSFKRRASARLTTTKSTLDHFCITECVDNPTRTIYTLELKPEDGGQLSNPTLKCIAGPCGGWNSVNFVRVDTNGEKAVSEWAVWGRPTTWELSADFYRQEVVAEYDRNVPVDGKFDVVASETDPKPRVEIRRPHGDLIAFTAGFEVKDSGVRLVEMVKQGNQTVFTYQVNADAEPN